MCENMCFYVIKVFQNCATFRQKEKMNRNSSSFPLLWALNYSIILTNRVICVNIFLICKHIKV